MPKYYLGTRDITIKILQKQFTSLETKTGRGRFEYGIIIWVSERTRRILLENRCGEIITDNNKTRVYYIVKWDRPPHKLQ